MGARTRYLGSLLFWLGCQSGQAIGAPPQFMPPNPLVVQTEAVLQAALAAGPTPLDALTPYGRREFLAQLTWGSRGLAVMQLS